MRPPKPERVSVGDGATGAVALAHVLSGVRHGVLPVVLYVTHNRGGGVQRHLDELLAGMAEGLCPLVLRPLERHWVELSVARESPARLRFEIPSGYSTLCDLLRRLGVGRIHFHHVLGLPPVLARLPADLAVDYDLTLHDFYLLGRDRRPAAAAGDACRRSAPEQGADTTCRPQSDGWDGAALVTGAARLIAPSAAAARHLRAIFPGVSVCVAFHPDWEFGDAYPPVRLRPLDAVEPLKVAVVGVLSREKGADVLEACAQTCQERGLAIEFHLIGTAYRRLVAGVIEHGAYGDDAELAAGLERLGIHVLWFPARSPETYCYALSLALEQGYPVVASELGAFPERLRGRPLSWLLDPRLSAAAPANFLGGLRRRWLEGELDAVVGRPWDRADGRAGGFYRTQYAAVLGPRRAVAGQDFRADELTALTALGRTETLREGLLRALVRIRFHPTLAALIGWLPRPWRRRFWHALSQRPVRELKDG